MKKLNVAHIPVFILVAAFFARSLVADYKQAVAFYNQGRYDKAIQELKPDLDENPDWEFGHRLLGLCYLKLNNNALAVSSLSRAAELKSTAFSTYYGMGQAYFNMQKYDNSIEALNKAEPLAAKEKQPDKAKARVYKLRGAAHYRLEKYSETVDDLTNALRTSQTDWTDFSMLGVSYYRLNRADEAIEALEKALSMKPDQAATAGVLGKVYFDKGIKALSAKRFSDAIQALNKAKELDSKNGYVYYNLAEAFLFEKKYADAEEALKQSAELMPKSPEVYERMGYVYEMQKKWDLALKAYMRAGEIRPSESNKEAIERIENNRKL
jgi:tetratricopeptide (TPR) repeat protein